MQEKITTLLNQITGERGLPTLLLNLEEVSKHGVLQLQHVLNKKSFDEIDVILQTPGGDIDAAYQIVRLIKRHATKVNIFVPLYAKSAGTLICLVGDQLFLSDLSELGPLDSQIPEERDGSPSIHKSALNGFKALEQVQLHSVETLDVTTRLLISRSGLKMAEAIKLASEFTGNTSGQLYARLDPMRIGEYARALDVGESYGEKILVKYMGWSTEDATKTVGQLVKGYPHHGYVIDELELDRLKLPHQKIPEPTLEAYIELSEEILKLDDDMIELVEPKKNKLIRKGGRIKK